MKPDGHRFDPAPLLVAVLVGVAAPARAQTQAPDDTDTQVSLGYEYRRRINERLRGFGDLVYKERYDPDSRWSTTGGVSHDLGKRFRIEGGLGLYYTHRPDLLDTFETRLWQAQPSIGRTERPVMLPLS